MILSSKGQLTIPAALRSKFDLHAGDHLEAVEVDGALLILRHDQIPPHGRRLVDQMRGTVDSKDVEGMNTDEIMELLRGRVT